MDNSFLKSSRRFATPLGSIVIYLFTSLFNTSEQFKCNKHEFHLLWFLNGKYGLNCNDTVNGQLFYYSHELK